MKEIKTREDLSLLVHTFYDKVRLDELIGPVFNSQILDWDHHLNRLTDFWETNLFGGRIYKGNPIQVHIDVDKKYDNTIAQAHFDRWLQLWNYTIDEHFEGEATLRLKNAANNMSSNLFIKMVMNR